MKTFISFILIFQFITAQSQNFIDKHFSSYENMDESTVVHVAAKTFDLASVVLPSNNEEQAEVKELVSTIESLDVVAIDNLENAQSELQRGLRILEGEFEELMNMKDGSNRFHLFIDEEDDIVYELAGIGKDETEFILLSITGEIPLEVLSELLSRIETEQVIPVTPLKKFDASAFSVYPNPVKSDATLNIDIPQSLVGGKGTIFDLNGKALSNFDLVRKTHQLNTSGLQAGTYMVGLQKEDIVVKKQIVVIR